MTRQAYKKAIGFFIGVVSRVPRDRWDALALGVWNVRDLVGHASRAMLTVEQYATVGADRAGTGTPDDVAERGRIAGRQLGPDPLSSVKQIAERVAALVDRLPDDHVLRTPFGSTPLIRYLPSRVTELTIHTIDLGDAIGIKTEPPSECLEVTLTHLAGTAVRRGVAREVMFVLTGRQALPPGFNLLG